MHSRPQRVGDQLREELSQLLQREIKDPGVGFTTITWVKVSADLQNARVYYTVLGDAKARRDAARALARAAPFLRRQIAGRLRLRRAPELTFTYDESVARGERVERLLQEIRQPGSSPADEDAGSREPSE